MQYFNLPEAEILKRIELHASTLPYKIPFSTRQNYAESDKNRTSCMFDDRGFDATNISARRYMCIISGFINGRSLALKLL